MIIILQFYYKAAEGSGKIRTGRLTGNTRDEVILELKKKGLLPIRVKEIRGGQGFFDLRRFKKEDLLAFTQQLTGLLESGIQLNKAMEILVNLLAENPLGPVIKEVHRLMHEGASFSQALERKKEVFDPLYINLVKVGEAGGLLPQVMKRLSLALEAEINLKNNIVSNLTYPGMVLALSMVSTIFLLWKVVPQFELLFAKAGGELPLITQVVLNFSRGLSRFGLFLLAVILIAVFASRHYLLTPQGRLAWDRFWLRAPLFGVIVLRLNMAEFARNLGMLLKSGVPLLEGLGLLKKTIKNQVLAGIMADAEAEVRKGGSFARFLSRQEQIPFLVTQMVGVGEEAGNLDEMCEHLGRLYEADAKRRVERLLALLGPVLVLVLTGIIFFIALAVILPVMSFNII
ncbi:MAG TPA: hypothetical protein GXZ36_08310 [Firmicutes bacterium]|nr:hypothetical protein [Bacillota bacterium]